MAPFSSTRLPLRTQKNNGFSLVEVLVSILMIAGFLTTAMQALISATAIKVKSEEISEATNWIQEDLEAIRFEANRLGLPSGSSAYVLDVNGDGLDDECTHGYATELRVELINDSDPAHASYQYADETDQTRISSLGGRSYFLRRKLTPVANTLQVEHMVLGPEKDLSNPISELYSEVIPDVAFACP